MEMDVRRNHVVYRGENSIWEFGSESRNRMAIYNFFHTGKASKFVVFVLGAAVPSVENLQLCSLSALNAIIKFRPCAELRRGVKKVWKHLPQSQNMTNWVFRLVHLYNFLLKQM